MPIMLRPYYNAPAWAFFQTASINTLTSTACSLFLRSISPLQGGVVGLVSHIAAYVITGFLSPNDYIRRKIYALSHLLTVPIVCSGALLLGCSMSLSAVLILTIVNVAAAYFGAHFCCDKRRRSIQREGDFGPELTLKEGSVIATGSHSTHHNPAEVLLGKVSEEFQEQNNPFQNSHVRRERAAVDAFSTGNFGPGPRLHSRAGGIPRHPDTPRPGEESLYMSHGGEARFNSKDF